VKHIVQAGAVTTSNKEPQDIYHDDAKTHEGGGQGEKDSTPLGFCYRPTEANNIRLGLVWNKGIQT
jgi:hypothetical protein